MSVFFSVDLREKRVCLLSFHVFFVLFFKFCGAEHSRIWRRSMIWDEM